jgi:hypothetical protein
VHRVADNLTLCSFIILLLLLPLCPHIPALLLACSAWIILVAITSFF